MKKLMLSIVSVLLLAGGLSAAITKGPYMIYANNASGMTVLWQTSIKETCSLQWGTSTSYSGGTISSTEYNTSHQHKKTISGLAAGTKYYYKVNVGTSGYTGSFRTAPASSATAVKFLVYGDTRSNPDLHNTVASRMVSTINADSGYQTFALHVGDLVDDGQTESDWTNEFFPRSKSSILSFQSKVAIQGTRGNHEGNGTLYKKYFPYPFVADGYWSFDYGPVHVTVIDQCVISRSDSGFNLSSTQYNWVTNDLAKTSKKWKVVLVHHPGYSAGGHVNNTYLINTLRPQFEKYDVTAVFGGHNHYYARALRNKIHYVTSGGGGASKTSVPDTTDAYIVSGTKGLQFCKVEISGDTFVCKSVAAETGSIIDTFTVTKAGGTPTASCHIDTPTGNLTKNLGDILPVTVTAADSDGIERVKVYMNNVELASDSSSPYSFNLALTNAGTFTLTAKVKDLLGNYTDSDNSRIITVNSGGPTASCHIDIPTGNVTKNVGDTLAVTVSATDSDGIERVKIYTNGTEIASDSVAPYSFNVPLASAGTFTLTAKVKDVLGNYTDSDNSRIITVQNQSTEVTLLNEGFEGDFSVNWATIEAWKTNTTYKHSGSRSALADNNANNIYGKDLNTASYNTITISLWYRDDDIDADDDVCLYLYDGSAYVNVFEMNATTEDTWLSKTLTYTKATAPQYFKTNFKLRVRGNSIDSGENLWLDDVKVVVE